MGALTAFNITPFIEQYGIEVYRETGTGEGVSLRHALLYPFRKFYSVDADVDWIRKAQNELGRDNLSLVASKSTDAIKTEFELWDSSPCLWFLDAHFLGGADFHKTSYEKSLADFGWDSLPLENELKLIQSLRDWSKDVIIIDDWILYDPNRDYETIRVGSVWRHRDLQVTLGLETIPDPIINLLSPTHNIEISLKHQGYLIATPK